MATSLIVPMAVLAGGGAIPTALGLFGDQGLFPQGFIILGDLIFFSAFLTRVLKPARNAGSS